MDPFAPPGSLPFEPYGLYPVWWAQVEECAGRQMRFDEVEWYYYPRARGWPDGPDKITVGAWSAEHNRITLGDYVRGDSMIVRHEELHAILKRGDHPTEFFFDKCGHLVSRPYP